MLAPRSGVGALPAAASFGVLFSISASRDRSAWRVKVDHQSMTIVADRIEREYLRVDFLLQLDHHPHHAGAVRPARMSLM